MKTTSNECKADTLAIICIRRYEKNLALKLEREVVEGKIRRRRHGG
jgi:hypothetical protein